MPDLGEWDDAKEPILAAGRGRPPALRYPTLDTFVQEFVVRELWADVTVASRTWCPEWWKHSAAIMRLEAMHRSFEHLRQDPGLGVSTWLRDHADYHMGVLTDPNGIFKGCSLAKGHDSDRAREIPVIVAPAGLFATDD
jgi:hypothetical protein